LEEYWRIFLHGERYRFREFFSTGGYEVYREEGVAGRRERLDQIAGIKKP
jgi:hypothetical protein